jgi:hypothetical protein
MGYGLWWDTLACWSEGVGESQFGRLERKPSTSTLSILWFIVSIQISGLQILTDLVENLRLVEADQVVYYYIRCPEQLKKK